MHIIILLNLIFLNFSGNSTTIVAFQVYVFNGNDIKEPSGLLIQLLIINGQAPTTTTTTTTAPATISLHQQAPSTTTSAEILTRLVISNSSPLPCESMVISAIQTLLNNQGITFPDNVTVMNYTYESKVFFLFNNILSLNNAWARETKNLLSSTEMSDTSYAINITFYMTNIRMHGNDACCGKLGDNIKSSVNNAVSMHKLQYVQYILLLYCWHWFPHHRHHNNDSHITDTTIIHLKGVHSIWIHFCWLWNILHCTVICIS